MSAVAVRFAPSPTGRLHVGNARAALLNWLYARRHGGTFLLRLDDTDVGRSTAEFAAGIEADLRWLGLDWDRFAKQSDRFDLYRAATEKLKAAGRLYACYETAEELELRRTDSGFGRNIFIVDVEPPKPRLRYSFVGDALLARLGWNVEGTYIDEQNFIYRRYAEPAYARVIGHRLPHYRRVGAIERMILFRYQRLLLPFGDESGVQTVLGYARAR